MSILIDNQLIRPILYTPTYKDLLFNSLYDIMYGEGFLKEKIDKGFYQDERGRDSFCTWDELFYFETLVDYFILMKDTYYKIQCVTQEDIDKLKSDYKLDCLRKTILCKFNNTSLFDKMLLSLGLTIDGLGNATEGDSGNTCIPVIIVQ